MPLRDNNYHHLFRRGKAGVFYLRVNVACLDKELCVTTKTSAAKQAVSFRDKILSALHLHESQEHLATTLLCLLSKSKTEIKRLIEGICPDFFESDKNSPTISQTIEKYLESKLRKGHLAPHVIQTYRANITQFQTLVGDLKLKAITPGTFEGFFLGLEKSPSLSRLRPVTEDDPVVPITDRTIFNKFICVKAFLQWCYRAELIDRNPMDRVDLPSYTEHNTVPIPSSLAEDATQIRKPSSSRISDETWDAIVYVLRYTGARLGEVSELKATSLETIEGIWCIKLVIEKSKNRKDGAKFKWVPVHPRLKPILEKLISLRPEGFLFPDVGCRTCTAFGQTSTRYGDKYSEDWNHQMKLIDDDLSVHSWRAYVSATLKNAGVSKELAMDITGHARGDVHDRYAGRGWAPTLYAAICKLP